MQTILLIRLLQVFSFISIFLDNWNQVRKWKVSSGPPRERLRRRTKTLRWMSFPCLLSCSLLCFELSILITSQGRGEVLSDGKTALDRKGLHKQRRRTLTTRRLEHARWKKESGVAFSPRRRRRRRRRSWSKQPHIWFRRVSIQGFAFRVGPFEKWKLRPADANESPALPSPSMPRERRPWAVFSLPFELLPGQEIA